MDLDRQVKNYNLKTSSHHPQITMQIQLHTSSKNLLKTIKGFTKQVSTALRNSNLIKQTKVRNTHILIMQVRRTIWATNILRFKVIKIHGLDMKNSRK